MAQVGRTSDIGTFEQITNAQTHARGKIANLTDQLATGKKAHLFSEIASQARTFTGNVDEISENTQYINNMKSCVTRLDAMELRVRNIINNLTEFRTRLMQVLNPVAVDTSFNQFCTDTLHIVAASLNAQDLEERNLFGGNKTSGIVCDITRLPTFSLGQPPSYVYAVGDTTILEVDIDEETSIPYGVTAFDKGFAETLQCLQIGAQNVPGTDRTTYPMQMLQQCMTVSTQAVQDLGETLNGIITKRKQLNDQTNILQKDNAFLQENIANIMDIDPAEVYTKLVQMQTQLTISLYALKKAFSTDGLVNLLN